MPSSTELSALEAAGAVISETSLRVTNPEGHSWEDYENLGRLLGGIGRGYPWWVGDFLNTVEDVFGEEFAQMEALLPHSPQTCANYKSVAKLIPAGRRGEERDENGALRGGLHLSLASELTSLPPQKRDELIAKAMAEGWKREEMREAAREAKGILGQLPPAKPKTTCPSCGHTWET